MVARLGNGRVNSCGGMFAKNWVSAISAISAAVQPEARRRWGPRHDQERLGWLKSRAPAQRRQGSVSGALRMRLGWLGSLAAGLKADATVGVLKRGGGKANSGEGEGLSGRGGGQRYIKDGEWCRAVLIYEFTSRSVGGKRTTTSISSRAGMSWGRVHQPEYTHSGYRLGVSFVMPRKVCVHVHICEICIRILDARPYQQTPLLLLGSGVECLEA